MNLLAAFFIGTCDTTLSVFIDSFIKPFHDPNIDNPLATAHISLNRFEARLVYTYEV